MYVISLWKTTTALEKRLGVESCFDFSCALEVTKQAIEICSVSLQMNGLLPLGDFPFMEGIDL